MSKYTIDFLTWLKGLFYTETEVDNLLENKLNTSEAQAQVTKFTNKDRVNIDRLLRYMENDGAENFYTLALKATSDEADGIAETNTFTQDDGDKIGLTDADYLVLYAGVYKDGTLQTGRTDSVTFKLTDGTVLGTSNTNTGASSVKIPNHIYLDLGLRQEGIYYMYAEATISGSVVKSNIIRVFVKDNTNILSIDQWSAGEYTNTLNNISNGYGQKVELTNNCSKIGEKSCKINRIGDSAVWSEYKAFNPTKYTFTGTLNLLNKNKNTGILIVINYSDNTQEITQITVPPTSNWINTSIMCTADSNKIISWVSLRCILPYYNCFAYIDNLKLN